MKIIIRFSGEILLKSTRVSRSFQKQLIQNLKASLKARGYHFTIKVQWSRALLDGVEPEAIDILRNLYGIQSFAVVQNECVSELK